MVGILKNSCQMLIACLIICSLVSCEKKNENPSRFIENNFLTIVDSVAYEYGAFILPPPLPNNTILKRPFYSGLAIKLNDSVKYSKEINQYILSFFESDKKLKSVFKDVLEKAPYSEILLDAHFSKKIGRYHLFFNADKIDPKIKYAGRIDIDNLKIYQDKALLTLTESVGNLGRRGKSAITYLVLFSKENNKWKMIKKEVLYMT